MYTGCVLALCEVRLPGGSVCRLLDFAKNQQILRSITRFGTLLALKLATLIAFRYTGEFANNKRHGEGKMARIPKSYRFWLRFFDVSMTFDADLVSWWGAVSQRLLALCFALTRGLAWFDMIWHAFSIGHWWLVVCWFSRYSKSLVIFQIPLEQVWTSGKWMSYDGSWKARPSLQFCGKAGASYLGIATWRKTWCDTCAEI